MADTQLNHIGGLIKAALNAATTPTVSCSVVFPYRLTFGSLAGSEPCIELYREKEDFVSRGNRSQRLRNVTVRLNYYAGPEGVDKLNDWAGYLVSRVQYVDDVLETGYHASYSGGANLYTLAGIESIELQSVDYDYAEAGGTGESSHPAFSAVIQMVHRYVRDTEGNEPLARIDGEVIGAGWQAGITSGSISADTSVQDGVDGQVTATGKFFESATAAFVDAHIGWYIRIADATNPGNDGSHLITARSSATKVTLGAATTLVNEGPGLHWVLVESP